MSSERSGKELATVQRENIPYGILSCHAWHFVPVQKDSDSLRKRTFSCNVKETPCMYDNAAQRQQSSGSIEHQQAATVSFVELGHWHASSALATVQHDYWALRRHRPYSRDFAETNLIYYDDSHWRQCGPYLWRLPATIVELSSSKYTEH